MTATEQADTSIYRSTICIPYITKKNERPIKSQYDEARDRGWRVDDNDDDGGPLKT